MQTGPPLLVDRHQALPYVFSKTVLARAHARAAGVDAVQGIDAASDNARTTTRWLHGGFDLDIGGRTWIAANGEIRADSRGNQITVQLGQRF